MRFTPLSEEELQTAALAPDGLYNYQVLKAEDGISQAGNDKIDLTLKIWDDAGKQSLIFSNLSLIKLLKHFCDVNGLQEHYLKGEISASLCDKKSGGKVLIGIQGEKPNPNGGMYQAKNIVKDYVVAPKGSALNPMKPLPEVKDDFSDDVPF